MNNRFVLILASLAFVALCWWSVARRADFAHPPRTNVAGAPAAPGETPAPPEPSLHVTQSAGDVFLDGDLPSQAIRDAVVARARTLYGAGNVVDRLRVAPGLANAGWVGNAAGVLPAFGKDAPKASLIADGETVSLRGQVPSADVKTKLVADANAAAGENVTVIDDLTLGATAPASTASAATSAPASASASAPTAAPATPGPTGVAGAIARSVGARCNHFDSGSTELTPECERGLDAVAQALRASPDARLIIEGHTDNVGAREVNLRVSERRAKAVKAYLLSKGVDSHHAIAIGYGDTRPIADNSNSDGRAKNRRIEFVVK